VLAQRLDASLGLVALNKGPSYDLWQVTGPVARARVVAADGTVTALSSGTVNMSGVTAPAGGGTLVLAEPYGGWTATLNGHALRPVTAPVDGWAQGFVLPPGGGQLSVTRDNLARVLSLFLELIATLAICLLALPGKRADPAEEAEALTALREARSDKRAASSLRRTSRSVRTGIAGHWAASGADRFAFARRRPGRPRPEPEPAEQVPAGQQAADEEKAAGAAKDAAPAQPDEPVTTVGPVDWARGSFVGRAEKTSAGGPPRAPWDMAGEWGSASRTGPSPAWTDNPLETTKFPADTGFAVDAGQRDDQVRLPGQRASTPDSPVQGTPVPESKPPWETRPQRAAPWESDSRGPAAPPGSRPSSRTGAQPVPRTGPQSIAWTGPQPGTRAGEEPASRAGAEAASGTGPRPVSRTGSPPVSRTDAHPAPGTGPHRIFSTEPQPASGTGGQPVSRTEPRPAAPTGAQPASMAPWESDAWGKAPDWDAVARDREVPAATPSATVVPAPESAPASEPAGGSGARPVAGRPAKPERHSHRAAKHSKPSRWRGSGNRSTRDGES
jgi:hypothetical protein